VNLTTPTLLNDFWKLFPADTEEKLLELDPDGRAGVQTVTLEGVGRVEYWLDACSEGADRGGYLPWYKLLDVTYFDRFSQKDEPVELESETDGSELYFAGRSSLLG
jgi:hypothetical protein